MVFMGMGQDQHVDPVIPRRQALVERDEQASRVGATVHHEASALSALHQDPIALAHVEDDNAHDAIGSMGDDEDEAEQRSRKADRGEPGRP